MLGTREAGKPETVPKGWEAFAEHGIFPNLESLHFVARAITPPRRPKRFDTRFFACDADHVMHKIEGVVGPHAELTELKWLTSRSPARGSADHHHRGAGGARRPHRQGLLATPAGALLFHGPQGIPPRDHRLSVTGS